MYIPFTENNNNRNVEKTFFCPDRKMLFFSFDIWCFPAFDGLPTNFTIFLCICDVPILMWVILTNKPETQLRVWETTVYLYWDSGVLPAEALTLRHVISVTHLFCHLSFFFLSNPGEMLDPLVEEVCDVCGRGLKCLAYISSCVCWSTRTLLSPI